jgi:hypothetical protein
MQMAAIMIGICDLTKKNLDRLNNKICQMAATRLAWYPDFESYFPNTPKIIYLVSL